MMDLVVYGASGFTGQLVCRYLRRHAPAGLRWALAGRDAAKLEQIAAQPLDELPLPSGGGAEARCEPSAIIGGCSAESAVQRIVKDTKPRVVLSTAGPFIKHSDALVGACARAGISYVDINGEIPWVKRLLERDDEAARESGALIVPNCGFDSVPSDIGAQRATQLLWQGTAEGVADRCVGVATYMQMNGVVSGGTIETGLLMEDLFPGEMRKPFLIGGDEFLTRGGADAIDADPEEAYYDRDVQRWVAPFGMARINSRVVRRSAGALGAYAGVDPTVFTYREVQLAPGGALAAEKMARNAAVPPEKLRQLRDRGRLPSPGSGPSAERRAASSFLSVSVATSASGRTAAAAISGGDPGYDETAKMVSEAALTLLLPDAVLDHGGGVLTPAAALGSQMRQVRGERGGVYVQRLENAGMRFEDHYDLSRLPGSVDLGAG